MMLDRNWLRIIAEMERSFQKMMEDIGGESYSFGYSITRGPDGRTEVKTFGDPEFQRGLGFENPEEEWSKTGKEEGYQEPFADTIYHRGLVTVTLEMPGIGEEDLQIDSRDKTLEIRGQKGERKYYKQLDLEFPVDPQDAEVRCNNGIVEIRLKPLEKSET